MGSDRQCATATRDTRQKRDILSCMASLEGHFTADELLQALRERGDAVGKATVYRFLKQLEREGHVLRFELAGGSSACYQYAGASHDCSGHFHLKCDRCGQVLHMDAQLVDGLVGYVREHCGFGVDASRLVLYGTCDSCARGPA